MIMPQIDPADIMADQWVWWCGEDTQWVKQCREFGRLGGLARYWCGMPQNCSAIPLAFELFAPDGRELPSNSRLKDIRAAIATLRAEQEKPE